MSTTIQGAPGVNSTLTAGTDYTVATQAAAIIQNAHAQATVMGSGSTAPTGYNELVVNAQAGSATNFSLVGGQISAPGYQYFIVSDTLHQISVTAGGAANQAVILGTGPIAFYTGFGALGASGTIVGGDGGKTIDLGTGTNFAVYTGAGNDVISLINTPNAGRNTVQAGAGSNAINLGAAPAVIRSTGNDTIAVSAGATTVQAIGNAQDSVSGGSGSRTFVNGTASSTVSGGSGSATVVGGAGGGQFTGGSSGNNLLIGGAGMDYLKGAGSGDVLIATSTTATQVLQAGAGNETLLGSLSTMNNIFQAGSGSDLIIAGSGNDAIYAGTGSATITGGAGSDAFVFNTLVAQGGQVTITDFAPGVDRVSLVGYGDQPANLAAAAQQVSANASRVVLSDGTSITFLGLSSVSAAYFG